MSLSEEALKHFKNEDSKPVIVSAEVLSVDRHARECDVLPVGSTAKIFGVRLTGYSNPETAFYCAFPKVGSTIYLAYLEDSREEAVMLSPGELDRFEVYCPGEGKILFSGDQFGGLTKTVELRKQLDKNNKLLEGIIDVLSGVAINEPGNGSPSALQNALKLAIEGKELGNFEAIENKNIKHG